MKERPILFSGQMVRAIREGRKTQTRRILKPQGSVLTDEQARAFGIRPQPTQNQPVVPCPYGKPGDQLWVKETHWRQKWLGEASRVRYRADDMMRIGPNQFSPAIAKEPKWMPSIFMPRWASRITLEIVSVRVERLNKISNEDCWKEGMCDATNPELKANRKWFSELWESIKGPGSWDLNPWVWVVEFKEVKL